MAKVHAGLLQRGPVTPAQPSHGRIRLPFFSTAPLSDLQIALLLTPLWWVLGIEQLIWPVLLLIPLAKLLVARSFCLHVPPTLGWLVFFGGVYLLSAFFIVEPFRLITFARSFGVYVAAIMTLILCLECIRTRRDLMRMIDSILFVVALAVVVGFLAILDVFRPSFVSAIGYVMPDAIKSTGFGARIAVKAAGEPGWFAWIGTYFRVRSFFMYSTHYAAALVVTFPLIVYRVQTVRSRWLQTLLVLLALLLLINLAYTTARMSILALTAGGLYYLGFVIRARRIAQGAALAGAVLLTAILLYLSLFESVPVVLTDQLSMGIENFANARGSSTGQRLTVYRVTLEGWTQRPLLGWGTERDVPGAAYPAGSHSYYLGTLYKQGMVGLFVFAGLLVALWRETRPRRARRGCKDRSLIHFVEIGRWILVTFLLNSLTDSLDLDSLTSMLIWTTFGLLLAASHCLRYGNGRLRTH